MSLVRDFAVVSRRVLTEEGLRPAAVLVAGERIAAVVPEAEAPPECPQRAFGNHVVIAGLVDSHVHINEPGRTEWEGFWSATRGAAAGGVTTLVDMPLNSIPPGALQASEEVLESLARENAAYEARFGHIFIVCATGKTAPEMLDLLRERRDNDPDTELRVASDEQAKITRLRHEKLLGS